MNLQNILFSWSILSSCVLSNAMEQNPSQIYRFAKQNSRWVPTTQINKQRAVLSLNQIATLTEEQFKKLSADQFELLPEGSSTIIEQSFNQKFGYNIPTHPDDYTKTTAEAFFSNVFAPLNNATSTAKSSTKLTVQQQPEEKIEKERLKRMMMEKNKKVQKEQEKIRREQEKAYNEQRILAAHKKERTLQATQKKMMPKQSPQRRQQPKNPLAQKRAIKSNLIKQYKCQTEKQLKDLLFQECSNEFPCMGEYISDHTAFHYDSKTNELVIYIGDAEIKKMNDLDCG